MPALGFSGTRFAPLLLGASLLAHAAPQHDDHPASAIPVQTEGPSVVRVDHVIVQPGKGGLRLTGHLHRPYSRRNQIRGHYHVTAYDSGDAILASKIYRWGRTPFRSRLLHFTIDLPINPDTAKSISIVHHYEGERTG